MRDPCRTHAGRGALEVDPDRAGHRQEDFAGQQHRKDVGGSQATGEGPESSAITVCESAPQITMPGWHDDFQPKAGG